MSEKETMNLENSRMKFFVFGSLLLIVPLLLVVFWAGPDCASQSSSIILFKGCTSSPLFEGMISFFPFLMAIGGVLIGYNLKKISDSNLPKEEIKGKDDFE